jgi:hypothetical protein
MTQTHLAQTALLAINASLFLHLSSVSVLLISFNYFNFFSDSGSIFGCMYIYIRSNGQLTCQALLLLQSNIV